MSATVARAIAIRRAATGAPPMAAVTLRHDERRLRRRLLALDGGGDVLVDLAETTSLADGDRLILEDGREILVRAADEDLYEIAYRDPQHLAEIAWHLGNRHLPAEIDWNAAEGPRIRIARDHVIRAMLAGLGASVDEVRAPFSPLQGAYHHGHGEAHALLVR